MRLGFFCVCVCLLLAAAPHATTVLPPSFQELVGEADIVFESEVVDTRSRATTFDGNEVIYTDVTFRVSRALKGRPGSIVSLQFLGGEVGDRGMKVYGMPTFARGDRDVIFAITSQPLISPLVRLMHGRVRVVRDGGTGAQESVRLYDGTPLRQVATFGAITRQDALSQTPALSLTAFEAAVSAEVERQAAQKVRR
jgi:hypothetical protein